MKNSNSGSPITKLILTVLAAAVVVVAFIGVLAVTGEIKLPADSGNAISSADKSLAEGNGSEAESSGEKGTASLPDVTVTVTIKDGANLPDGVKQLLNDFYYDKYTLLGQLQYDKADKYFDTSDTYGKMYSGFCNTSLELLSYIRQNRSADYSFDKAQVGITVTETKLSGGVYSLFYEINDAIDFNMTDKTSYSCAMAVEARAKKDSSGNYKFTMLAEDTDVNLLIEEQVMYYIGADWDSYYLKEVTFPSDVDCDEMFDTILSKLKIDADKTILDQRQQLEAYNAAPSEFALSLKMEHSYDREAAVAYSYKWVDGSEVIRNGSYSDYSEFGGNCQNYVSQSLHAGGIPMDWEGDHVKQWKWFDDYSNDEQEATGRVPSWSGVKGFYEYVLNNEGSGLVAQVADNVFSGQPGDVIHYLVEGQSHHAVIISDVVYDENGNVVDYLINSNTTDRVDFPMSAYGYTHVRLIRIAGYNT